jgi:hypothetical protein
VVPAELVEQTRLEVRVPQEVLVVLQVLLTPVELQDKVVV